jgi:elongator complex protein 3
MRGAQNAYDPYGQVTSRIKQLLAIGHEVNKVDLIIMGGTFPAAPPEYQNWFVKGCLDALAGDESEALDKAKARAEHEGIRNVGITVETRPDCVNVEEVDRLLNLGITRVEMGVQNVYDDIYEFVERGHIVGDVVEATRQLKDSGLKVCYHMMPGLPGSSRERDLEGFGALFDDPSFKPDMLKIYPTLVMEGTKLHDWWREGRYTPLSTEEAVELVADMKELVPPWVRIMRVQRDIPSNIIEAGVDKSHLRQLAQERLAERGSRCRCIRCREVGYRDGVKPDEIEVIHVLYEASGGGEVFISAENETLDILVGFLRMRIPSERTFRPEISPGSAIVRELHVYGEMVSVGNNSADGWQHKGWGRALMSEAERIAREDYDFKKLLVMSALGTKEYYASLGYHRDGVYVSKNL